MTKQEHIEAVEQVIWNWLQSHYQESCYTTELGKFTNALCDFWKIYNDNKDEFEQLKTNAEILAEGVRDLNAENYKLTEKVRKETAREILQTLYDECYEINDETGESMGGFVADEDILCLAKHYGVEVKE